MNEQKTSRECAEYIRERIKHLEKTVKFSNGDLCEWAMNELYWYKEILRCWSEDFRDANNGFGDPL